VSTPVSSVLAAVESGVTTRPEIATVTGLDPDVVDAAVELLLRLGRISTPTLRTACPDGGCAGCGSVTGTGCAPRESSGPVPVTVRTRSAGDH
jgi:hypothetical protein